MEKTIVIYLPEGFADWEGAFLMAELRENKIPLKIVTETGDFVMSIGGMKVYPEGSLADVMAESTRALVLIGSDSWVDKTKNQKALAMALEFQKKEILIAGICAATVALARVGLLKDRKHTSNGLGDLKYFVPDYGGEAHFEDKLAVTGGNVITAPGVAPLEFTYEIFNYLGVFTEERRKHWFAFVKHAVKPPPGFWG